LIVYADGPRSEKDHENVCAAREIARNARGFKAVTLVERDRNLGLAESIISGVTEVCQSHGKAIVIEDDLVVAPELLQFLTSGLERYAAEPRVFQISGYAYPAHDPGATDTFFLPMVSCWGWATWDRAWKRFERSLCALDALDCDPHLRRRFNVDGTYDYYAMACAQRAGQINSWGICWQLSLFANGGLVLYPPRSLVTNAGFDGSGTHRTSGEAFQEPLDLSPFDVASLSWPAVAEVDTSAYDDVKRMLNRSRPSLVRRLAKWLRA
jgi:hypothetical protein